MFRDGDAINLPTVRDSTEPFNRQILIVDRRYWLSLGVIYFDDNIQSI